MAYVIVVVDRLPQPMPPAKMLVSLGVPTPIVARWARVRRAISPDGLARKVRESRN